MQISEIARRTGLSVSTIRFYEKSGLCPKIERGRDGKRRFSLDDLNWLSLLASLRTTGMPMSNMRAFAALYKHGDQTVLERKAMLLEHQESLYQKQAELEHCRAVLKQKLETYDKILQEAE